MVAVEGVVQEKLRRLAGHSGVGFVVEAASGGEERVRQDGVVVSQDVLEPLPVALAVLLVLPHEAVGGQLHLALDVAGAGELTQVVAHAQDRVSHPSRVLLVYLADRMVEAVFGQRQVRRQRRACHDGAERPERPSEGVMGRFILPPRPMEIHEIPDGPVRVLGVHQKRQIRVQQSKGMRIGVLRVVLGHSDRAARVVVGAVAVGAIGNGEPGVLVQPRVVGEPQQVVQRRLRRLDARNGFRRRQYHFGGHVDRDLDFAEQFPVRLSDLRPGPGSTVVVRAPAQLIEQAFVLQQVEDRLRKMFGIAEGDESPAVVGQQLHRGPVGCGDDRLAGPDREGECAAGQLLVTEVGCDVDVRRTQEVVQLRVIHEPVMKDHVVLQTQVADDLLEAESI